VDVTFALIREGTSDDGLIPHLQTLLVRGGADAAVGASRPYKGPVAKRLEQLLAEESPVDIVFVHADADSRDGSPRRNQIAEAAQSVMPDGVCVPVVPVQELEAWLLVDEGQIRAVTGRPSGTNAVVLPPLVALERTASPKEILQQSLLEASGKNGRRLDKERAKFPQRRRTLLERLEVDGKVTSLPSFQRLLVDVENAVAALAARQS
jgi:hypothetical protein